MSVGPLRLNRVAADVRDAAQLKRLGAQRLLWANVKMSHHVHLTFALCARTGAAQFFQRDKTFAAIVPFQREFITDLLDVDQSHAATVLGATLTEKRKGF